MSVYVKGPWTVHVEPPSGSDEFPDKGGYRIDGPGITQLAFVWNDNVRWATDEHFGVPEAEGTARLIGAAPDLLDALRLMLVYFGHPARAEWINDAAHAEAVEMCVRARAAIAKATQP